MPQLRGLGQDTSLVRPTPEAVMPVAVAPTVKEIPYDYVATFALEGVIGNRVQDVINISTEGAFVAVAIGYSFLPMKEPEPPPAAPALPPQQRARTFILARRVAAAAAVTAGNIPNLVRAAVFGQERRFGDVLECIVERLCGIDFLYSVVDSGSGRELQNLPIHNIAGLGKADGDRPFRPLAKPMLFMPRSTIRIEIIEQSEGDFYAGGRLFFVLHGYKILGYGMTP